MAHSLLDTRQGAIERSGYAVDPEKFLVSIPGSGDFFLAMRLRAGFSLTAASRRLGIHKSTLHRIESSDMLPGEDVIEMMSSVFALSDIEKEYLKSKSRLLPPLSSQSFEKLTGIGELSERIGNLEMLGRLQVDFPGDLAFLAIEASLAPYVRGGNLNAARLLCRTYIAHGEWLERVNRCEQVRGYSEAVLGMRKMLYKSSSKVPKAEHWWVRAATMRSTCDVRDAFKNGSGRRHELSSYENVITGLRRQRNDFDNSSHLSKYRTKISLPSLAEAHWPSCIALLR